LCTIILLISDFSAAALRAAADIQWVADFCRRGASRRGDILSCTVQFSPRRRAPRHIMYAFLYFQLSRLTPDLGTDWVSQGTVLSVVSRNATDTCLQCGCTGWACREIRAPPVHQLEYQKPTPLGGPEGGEAKAQWKRNVFAIPLWKSHHASRCDSVVRMAALIAERSCRS
jgi:hypothetical protein